jgi:hypothetical protein
VPTEHRDYSATPLATKLGIRDGSRVLVASPPAGFALEGLPPGVELLRPQAKDLDVALLFVTRSVDLRGRFPSLARRLTPTGRLWIAWPKKSSSLDTDLDFDSVQRVGLDAGLVDNKSASITDAFQGVQFVIRLRDRPGR